MVTRTRFVKYLIAGSIIRHLIKYTDKMIGYITRNIVYRKGNVENNKIFVMTYDNRFNCNPKYIVKEILRRKLPVDIVWAASYKDANSMRSFPDQVRLVKYGSYSMFEEQASAKIWIDNALNCVWFEMPKKKNQIYFNTWHGSMGIKRLSGNKTWMWHARKCNKNTDYCITNSKFEEDVFRNTFWKDVEFLPYGHARNDILFSLGKEKEKIKEKVRNFYGISSDVKIFLYAPTFRDNGNQSCYFLDYEKIRKALNCRFSGKWVILARAHFKNRNNEQYLKGNNDFVYDGTLYPDMQELMVAVDIGMTDYSSWAYDYVLTQKPLFIYAPDINEYDQMRGFYYPIESTPFPVSYNMDEVIDNIMNFDNDIYLKNVSKFLEEKGCYENGTASARIVDKIEEVLGLTNE